MNNLFPLQKSSLSTLFIGGFILLINLGILLKDNVIISSCFVLVGIAIVFYWTTFSKNTLFPAILLLIPLSFNLKVGAGVTVDFPAELLIGLLVIVYVVRAFLKPTINKKILTHPLTILLFSELIWMLIASTTSNLPMVSLKRCLVRFCFLVVFYIIASHWLSESNRRKWFFILYAIGVIFPVLHTLFIHANYDFSKNAAYAMSQPFYSDHTIYGAALAFIFPSLLILIFNSKLFNIQKGYLFGFILLTLIVLAGEVFSFSRAAWISLVIAWLFYFLVKLKIKTWTLILGLAVISCTLFLFRQDLIQSVRQNEAISSKGSIVEHVESVTNIQTDASNLERVNRWMCALRMSQERPLLGFGPGMYQFEYGRFQVRADMTHISTFRGNRGHAHSELFNALSETGFPGMILALIIMFSVISYGLRVIYRSTNQQDRAVALGAVLGLITFYVHGFFNAFMDSDKMVALIYGSIAILVILDIQQKSRIINEEDHVLKIVNPVK